MSETSDKRSEEFLRISDQFQLGALVTEASHPVTAGLSEVAGRDTAQALDLLFQVDGDVVAKYREFVESGRAGEIKEAVLTALRKGGRVFFTGCGSTGRLSIQLVALWRDFWQRQRARGLAGSPSAEEWEHRAFSVMAGGDFALIKSVEGFEDFTAFGRKQIADLRVSNRDVVFAISEGGETSFVIGTAWQGVEAGAEVFFVYNNPDDVLRRHVQRSREVIEDPRIGKINLTSGPMAITGSTRMQATTIQFCVLATVLEMVLRELMQELEPGAQHGRDSATVPAVILNGLAEVLLNLRAPDFRSQLASLIELEEGVYRSGHRTNYYAGDFALDVLTDTTERSPTYCTPPFRRFDDPAAADSWAFLFTPELDTPRAWEQLFKRKPHCVEWSESEVRELVGEDKRAGTLDTIRRISRTELMRFRIGQDGVVNRPPVPGDSAIAILSSREGTSFSESEGFIRRQLAAARAAGARVGAIWIGDSAPRVAEAFSGLNPAHLSAFVWGTNDTTWLKVATRVSVKLVLNALSTGTMVRLGRVMGNFMIWVVPSNLKLIDRATRYLQKLTGLTYAASNRLLFEVIEYVEPRLKADQAYPPVVGLAVLRARHNLSNEEAEQRFRVETR